MSCAKTGKNNGFFGKMHSQQLKDKLSRIAKQRSPELIAKQMKNFNFVGQKHTSESIEKIRTANTGVIFSQERREKLSRAARTKYAALNLEMKRSPFYNSKACEYFEFLNALNGWNGAHSENGGEVCIEGYWLDYYEPTLNLVIEWDEKHHQSTKQHKIDVKKEKIIRETLNCVFLRINQEEMF